MTEVEHIVEALRIVESSGSQSITLIGDQGRALGPWQIHPDFLAQWYHPVVGDTWLEAMEKAATGCVQHYVDEGLTPFDVAQIFHLGYAGWRDGGPDKNYGSRFVIAYKGIAGE
jgi:hypothetical protein